MMMQEMRMRRLGSFTFVEMLAVITAVIVLIAIIMPALREARQRAKFVRWSAYNAQWNRDADCVVNFNFQEGSGNRLQNGGESCDWRTSNGSYNTRDFDGRLSTLYSDTTSNFTWSTGGRWGRYKKALRFKNGLNNCVQIGNPVTASLPIKNDAVLDLATGNVYGMSCVGNSTGAKTTDLTKVDPQRDALDFTPLDNFTVIAWMKFGDENGNLSGLNNYQCVFARCNWGVEGVVDPQASGFSTAQFDLYTDIKSSGTKKGSFDVDVFTLCPGYDEDSVDFKDANWKQVALRYMYPPPPVKAGQSTADAVYRSVDVFYNGQLQTGKRATYNTTANGSRTSGVTILGAARTTYGGGNYSFPFEGLMDEFMIFKKALPDTEIKGEYLMGIE